MTSDGEGNWGGYDWEEWVSVVVGGGGGIKNNKKYTILTEQKKFPVKQKDKKLQIRNLLIFN